MKIRNRKLFGVLLCLIFIFTGALFLSKADIESAGSDSKSWMSKVPDDVKLCNLNIPGTHDSGTERTTIFTGIVASCQSDSIPEQLEKGIRYLDIRIDSDLLVNHGGVSCYKSTFYRLYLNDVLSYISDFLKNNPSETVIMQLKEEGSGKGDFRKNVNNALSRYKNIYSSGTAPSELTLGEIRGKLLVFDRSGKIDNVYHYSGWANDCAYCKCNIDNSTALLQDKYNDKNADDKLKHIKDFYDKAWNDNSDDDVFYVNFTSCIGPYCPKLVAKSINKSFEAFVKENKSKKFGIVMMDNPGSSLIEAIYNLNC